MNECQNPELLYAVSRDSEKIKEGKGNKKKGKRGEERERDHIKAAWTQVKQSKSGLIIDTCKVKLYAQGSIRKESRSNS